MSEVELVLPRQLTDGLSDEVRNVPPPPSALQVPEPYAFRLADPDADAEMIAEWMNRPQLAEAWEYNWAPSRWYRYLCAQLDGSYSRPFIASLAGEDHGYVELYRAAKDSIATRYRAGAHDLGIHAAIADPEITNRGIAQNALPHFVAAVLTLDPQCRRIMFDPDHRNKIARRFCERGGCVFLGEHDMANRRMALYALVRNPDDVPELR
ncbi:MAG TPA: GNAT family N-acetyltransferase [Mycobacterium sp.]|nr:GNAT family N-acetyltransferase [Mycobacterium sp.]